MRKALIGLLGLLVIVAGGYYGANLWAKQRAENEVVAAAEAIRSGGGTATHGAVSFDLASQTLTVADVAVELPAEPKTLLKVGRLVATGVGQPAPGRLSVDRVHLTDVEVTSALTSQPAIGVAYKAPRIEVAGYSGPKALLRPVETSSPIDLLRYALEHFVATAATSALIPTLTIAIGSSDGSFPAAEYTYSGIALRNMRDGRIETMEVDQLTFTMSADTGSTPQKFTGRIAKIATSDFDANPVLAALAPAKAGGDDGYQRIYRQASIGPYTISGDNGFAMQIDAVTVDDLGVKPSKFPIGDLAALGQLAQRGSVPMSPDEVSALLSVVAAFYEATRIGKIDLRGLSLSGGPSTSKFTAIRLDRLENGRLAEFALDGLDMRGPQQEHVTVGRFALQGLDFAQLMRTTGDFTALGRPPNTDDLLPLLRLLDGVEIAGVVAPYGTGKKVEIDTAGISWGQFVGPVPTTARSKLRMTAPVEISDQDFFRWLAAVGLPTLTVDLDVRAGWAEPTRTFTLEPAAVELANLFSASAKMTVTKVAPDVFSTDPATFMPAAAVVEAGPVEIVVRDLGGMELALAQFAREQGFPPQAARHIVVAAFRDGAAPLLQVEPDLQPVVNAIAGFIEQPRGTLTIRISPRNSVALMPLLAALREDPMAALARLRVEAALSR